MQCGALIALTLVRHVVMVVNIWHMGHPELFKILLFTHVTFLPFSSISWQAGD